MSIGDWLILLLIFYLLYKLVRFVLSSVWNFIITYRYKRKLKRIITLTKAQQEALAELFINHMQEITDRGAEDILNTRRH